MTATAAEYTTYYEPPLQTNTFEQEHRVEDLSLDSTFPIEPEVDYRRKNRLLSPGHEDYLTPEQVDFYQKENLICFLCEFAGKVPFKKIPGIYTDSGKLKICNMDLIKMAEKAYQITGRGSREEHELIGLYRALGAISRGEANRIDIISPPKIADYMLVFSMQFGDRDPQIGGRPFHEVVLNRQENMRSLETSRGIYTRLAAQGKVEDKSGNFRNANDFIANPIMYNTSDRLSLARGIEAAGVSAADIKFSEEFEEEVRSSLSEMIDDYLARVDSLSHLNPNSRDPNSITLYQRERRELEDLRDTIFSFAKRIAFDIANPRPKTAGHVGVQEIMRMKQLDPYMYALYAQQIRREERAVITGGTSCPSLNTSSSMGIFSAFEDSGYSPEGMFHQMERTEMKDKITVPCPMCRCKCTYTRSEVAKKGILACKGKLPDGTKCTNKTDCWEPFFMAKTA